MKRVLAVLLCLLCTLFLLVACGDGKNDTDTNTDTNTDSSNNNNNNTDNQGHTHTFKTNEEWSKDAQGHWYDATCDCEDVTITKLNHTDANNDGACDVCAYTNHEHEYSEEWTADCTNHWNAADCGHTVAGINVAAHEDKNEDGRCDVCNYIIKDIHEHYYSTEWTTDGEYHWHAALCEHKVELKDKEAHNVNAAGFCTVCDAKVKEIDKTDIKAVLEAAIANNYKVVSGSVVYVNEIPDIDYQLSHSVYYVLGDTSSYVKRIEYGMAKERWYQLLGEDEVFGVTTEDGGLTIFPISADVDDLKGYNYNPSTMLGSYDSTATLAETLWAMYDISLKDTVTDRVVMYNAEDDMYVMSYTYLEVRVITGHDSLTDVGNDDSTAETKTDVVTHLYQVQAYFTIDENYVIDEAAFIVGAYNQDIDNDYIYDVETGTYTMNAGALADTYAYVVAQTSGERTYYTAYPKASIVPNSFDLKLPNGEIAGEEIKTAVGTYVQFELSNLKPFSANPQFINPNDFTITVIDNETNEVATFAPFYSTYSGAVCFNPNKVGSYTMTIKYADFEKVYTLTITPAAPNSVKLYPFTWIQGYGEMVYTVDEYESLTKIELDIGETIDFLIRVNPSAAEQLYTITVDSEDASISNVTLTNVVAFYEMLEECTAYQFKSDVAGKYIITLTSTVDANVTSTVEVYVGDVEQEVKTSETFEIPTPGNFEQSEEYVFTAGVAGTYVITAEGLDASTWLQFYDAQEDSWPRIQGLLPYSIELAEGEELTIRLYGWDADIAGQMVTVTVAKEASQNSVSYVIPTPGDFEKSEEYVFTAGVAGTYVITAEGLDASTWLQIYDAQEDSWPQIQGSLPYSIELAEGEELTIRLYGWNADVAGQKVTVTVSASTAGGDDEGEDTIVTPDGSDSNPFPLEENNTCEFPGGYAYVFYTYTATQAGTLTITATSDDYYWGYGSMPYAMENVGQVPSLPIKLAAGETIYFGASTSSEKAGTITFTATFEASGSGEEETTEPDGSAENPYVIENGTQIVVSATYYTPIYVTVNAGVTATISEGAQFITEADGPLGTTVTPVVTTTYAVYADTMAGAMVQIVGSTGTTEEPAGNTLVLGENAVYVTIVNYYCAGVEMTFTATEAGTYTISPAEGEKNADLTDMGTEECIETLPYEFTLEAGESITFLVRTSANVMTTTEDTIDLVISKK